MSDIRDTYRTWADVPPHVQRAVEAYDEARRDGGPEPPMSERNKCSIAPMVEAAIGAALVEACQPFANWAADNVEPDPHGDSFGIWSGNRCEGDRIKDWFGPSDFYRLVQVLAHHSAPVGTVPAKLGNTPTGEVLECAADMLDEAAQRLGLKIDMPVVARKLRELRAALSPSLIQGDAP